MKEKEMKIKLSYITGLRSVVLDELAKHPRVRINGENQDSIYIDFLEEIIPEIKELKSVARAYIVLQDNKYNPSYISNHKSILKNLIDLITKKHQKEFTSFKISCAGSDSPEVTNISKYIQSTCNLNPKEDADLKIYLSKLKNIWEIGIQITPRPLSLRDYKVAHMGGAMDPTIAYAMNSFCSLEKVSSYLNVFSGSGTLLIEAGRCYPNLDKLIGFDSNKKHLSLSIQNVKKAGLIKRILLKEGNIFDKPNLEKFDIIVSDLPFGMSISKHENLKEIYKTFVEYCQDVLNKDGRLVVYTSEYELLKSIIKDSRLKIIGTTDVSFITSVNALLKTKIIICKLKTN